MKRSVIFDLDGTLCDTSADLLAAANVALGVMGHSVRLDPSQTLDQATALRGGRAMLRLALSRAGIADEGEIDRGYGPLLQAYGENISQHTKFYPGAVDAVQRLRARGDAVAICTNKPEALARQLMTDLGALDLFDALVGADTLPVRKPDPAPLWAAVERAGGARGRTVLIGDSETDHSTARVAGVPSVLVTFAPGGASVAALGPDALLDDYADLEAVLGEVGL